MSNKSMKRSIKCRQIDMTMLQLEVDTSSGTPVASGEDANAVASIIDVGVGEFTLILKQPFSAARANKPKAQITMLEAGKNAHMVASDYDRVTVKIEDYAGVPQEGAVSMIITGANSRFSY